jgi:hypothetical protein
MTLQHLNKILDKYDSQFEGIKVSNQLELLNGLLFYDWQNPANINTFSHAVGLPQKNGQACPLFGYELLVFKELQEHKHLWIKKATGLGVTEFMLRYIAWLCFSSAPKELIGTNGVSATSENDYNNILPVSQMCIVTGPRIELAITLIDRMKRLFRAKNAESRSDLSSNLNRASL